MRMCIFKVRPRFATRPRPRRTATAQISKAHRKVCGKEKAAVGLKRKSRLFALGLALLLSCLLATQPVAALIPIPPVESSAKPDEKQDNKESDGIQYRHLDEVLTPHLAASDAYYLYDRNLKTLLSEKDSQKALPISSSARLMLALIAAERLKGRENIPISKEAADLDLHETAEPRLYTGITLPLDLLLCKLLYQDSDGAAQAIAEALAGGPEATVQLMNDKAHSLGLKTCHFANLNGKPQSKDGEAEQTCSLSDYAALLQQFLESEQLSKILPRQQLYYTLADGSVLPPFRNPIGKYWALSEGQSQYAYFRNRYDDSLAFFIGSKEPYNYLCILYHNNKAVEDRTSHKADQPAREPSRLPVSTLFLSDFKSLFKSIEEHYTVSELCHEGAICPDTEGVSLEGDRYPLVYLQTLSYVHPKDDRFILERNYIPGRPLARPIRLGLIAGQIQYKLADGRYLSAQLGPAKEIISGNSMETRLLNLFQQNQNIFLILVTALGLLSLTMLARAYRNLQTIRHLQSREKDRHGSHEERRARAKALLAARQARYASGNARNTDGRRPGANNRK